jgi:hypothetical protein
VKNVNPMDLVITRLVPDPDPAVMTDRAVTLTSAVTMEPEPAVPPDTHVVEMEPVVPPDKHVVMEIAVTQAHVKVV